MPLRRALESLRDQDLAPGQFEVLVVDNGSSDDTQLIVEGLTKTLGNLRYVHEPRLGVSNARNRGVSEAEGDVVAFLDDDATASRDWLARLAGAFSRGSGDPLCAGGRVVPVWERERPRWLPDSFLGFFSVVDYGTLPRPCKYPGEVLVGCNVAFQQRYLLETGGFDPLLGRRGSGLLGNEEIAVQQRIHEQGGIVFYEPNAVVHHYIPAERLSRTWLARRIYFQGISDVIQRQRHSARGINGHGHAEGRPSPLTAGRIFSSSWARSRSALLPVMVAAYALGVTAQTLRSQMRDLELDSDPFRSRA